ncbi:hypothetical protein [Acidisphaera sp. S103]|uniref:hypothetical protein n=1 Tax=Acidisphaera sp. S103 TaxID=1747223 RepID=UPI00131ECF4C|nr:hypothetical protein [Acidisphaera sp. S103]
MLKARILLKADASDAGAGWNDSQIAAALETSIDTVGLTRRHSPTSARKRIFDGAAEARLISLACSPPPKGRARWTLQLLESVVVELNIVDRASDNTISRMPKKHAQASPPEAMGRPAGGQRRLCRGQEHVLEVYLRPHDPARPVVCLDETSKQLISETRVPSGAIKLTLVPASFEWSGLMSGLEEGNELWNGHR